VKRAACAEVLHWAPFEPGALGTDQTGAQDNTANNTWNVMYRTSKFITTNYTCMPGSMAEAFAKPRPSFLPAIDQKLKSLPGAGRKACVTHTNLYQSLAVKFIQMVRPDKKIDVNVSMFDVTYNPTPIFDLLNDIYAMHVTGEVNVWSTHKEFNFIRSAKGPLKALLIYNTEVTKINVMIEKPSAGFLSKFLPQFLLDFLFGPKPCSFYVDKIERNLQAWRNLACPKSSRARMIVEDGQLVGEVTPYNIYIIDEDYLGWGQSTSKPQTGIIQTCEF
jgi:hypothetical protein